MYKIETSLIKKAKDLYTENYKNNAEKNERSKKKKDISGSWTRRQSCYNDNTTQSNLESM
jgi:hypothetical protein